MVRFRRWLSLLGCMLLLSACNESPPPQTVALENRGPLESPSRSLSSRPLQLCVGSMITPEDGYIFYQKLIDYLSYELDLPIEARDPGNYAEVNRALEEGRTDVAFICGGPYVEGHDRFGLQLLAAPVVEGRPLYYSNLIVPETSSARKIEDLVGKTFAFSDPQSNSGYFAPASVLAELGTTPEAFFSATYFSGAHDKSIAAVADGLVDGAAVDSLIWDYLTEKNPQIKDKAKVIARFGPYGIPPVVARKELDPQLQRSLRDTLLAMHENPRGRSILEGMNIQRFTDVDDTHYDGIRSIRRKLEAPTQGQP